MFQLHKILEPGVSILSISAKNKLKLKTWPLPFEKMKREIHGLIMKFQIHPAENTYIPWIFSTVSSLVSQPCWEETILTWWYMLCIFYPFKNPIIFLWGEGYHHCILGQWISIANAKHNMYVLIYQANHILASLYEWMKEYKEIYMYTKLVE